MKIKLYSPFIIFILLLTSLTIQPALANQPTQTIRTLYAKPRGTGDCSSWNNACDLSIALSAATPYSEIRAAKGVYTPTHTISPDERSATFPLKSNVSVYGCFAGTGTEPDSRDCTTNITVLSGDIDGNDTANPSTGVVTNTTYITGTNAYHVVTTSGVTETAILDGFIITAGKADGTSPQNEGGGMFNINGDPTLTNITFKGNYANNGGGMFNSESSPTLDNIVFSGNAANAGGGIYNSGGSGTPILTNVTFNGNSATYGGGIHNYMGNLGLTNITFSNNSATGVGGGLSIDTYGNITLINVIFRNNLAGNGGGMSLNNTSPKLTNVVFNKNSATNGGGIYNCFGSPTLTNVTFSNNSATNEGNGGGLYNFSGSEPTLVNTILWGNKANSGTQIYNDENSRPSILYSLVQYGCPTRSICDGHLLTSDPRFEDAANNNLNLGNTSPAIDAGDSNATGLNGITTDIEGKPRFIDVPIIPDTGSGTPPVDLGAYEHNYRVPTTTQLEVIPNPSRLGNPVTFAATVSASSGGITPIGNVDFYSDENLLGNSRLNDSGTAHLTYKELPVGSHEITAEYKGNDDFVSSTSEPINLEVTPPILHLPLIFRNYMDYFNGPWEQEPNNDYEQANGPLHFGQEYYAHSNDSRDFFSFYLPKASTLTINMNDHKGEGVQMLLYDRIPVDAEYVERTYEEPYEIVYTGEAGWYYIYIYAASNYSNEDSYTLQVNAQTTTASQSSNNGQDLLRRQITDQTIISLLLP